MKEIIIALVGDLVYSNSEEAISLQARKFLGEFKNGRVFYNPSEVLYMNECLGARVMKGSKELTFDLLLKTFSRSDKEVFIKYSAFKNLRERGYVVKAALKFGGGFRVYERGKNPKNAHSSWILHPISERSSIKMHEFASKNRVAHSTNKKLLIAVVDGEGDVTYYEIGWMRM